MEDGILNNEDNYPIYRQWTLISLFATTHSEKFWQWVWMLGGAIPCTQQTE